MAARLAVNPGIPPAFIARVSGAPVPTYQVRPRVFASTQGVAGAVQIRSRRVASSRRAARLVDPVARDGLALRHRRACLLFPFSARQR